MAWSASGLYVLNFIDMLDNTQLAIDLSLTTHKIALYTNSDTPNFSSEVSYSASNESSGAGYTAGGQVVVTPTITENPAGSVLYDLGDQTWAAPTTVTTAGCKLYADALGANNLIAGVNFGGVFSSVAGSFTIQWAAPPAGVFSFDLTP